MNKNERIARTLLIVFGGVLTFFMFYSLLFGLIFELYHLNVYYTKLWFIFFPIFLLLGLAYLFLGILFNKIPGNKLLIHLIISIITIIWFIVNHVGLILNGDAQKISFIDFAHLMASLTYIFGIILFSLFLLIPQYIIGYHLNKAIQKRKADEQE